MRILSFFTKILHFLPSELSHSLALNSLKMIHTIGLLHFLVKQKESEEGSSQEIECSDFLNNFRNRVGFAAGLDKNGDYIDCLAALGVAFIEVGTITPLPQKGNVKPRLFRNKTEKSLLNRLGFNNKGVDHLVKNLKRKKSTIVLGTSIGKNFNTPNEVAYKDYLVCLEKVYEITDYIAINISSPNTENLRELSEEFYLRKLLNEIKTKQLVLSSSFGYKPIFIKISPDEELENLKEICNLILELKLDGIICSNTTINHFDKNGKGGLSGTLLKKKSTDTLLFIKKIVRDRIPVMASGGVMSVADYQEKIDAGADLVQLYTGFIYEGPKLIQDIVNFNSLN